MIKHAPIQIRTTSVQRRAGLGATVGRGSYLFPLAACCGLLLLGAGVSHAAEPTPAGGTIDYLRQVKPLLQERCYSCHGVLKQEASLRLETRELILNGGDSGAVVVPGDVSASLLWERVSADESSRMPPAGEGVALKPAELAILRSWIEQGALAPKEETPLGPRDHWSFRRIDRPDIPATGKSHPIDSFLEQKRSEHGLVAQPNAERSLLLRRLYLDLIGLPPTAEQLRDERPWETIVDELLASPHYGERWGRHWMDVWRYSDWYGLGKQLRDSQKHMWRWRDWIVNSLNADKGYDRMIEEMLAGDELAPTDPDVIAGTGFLARNYYLFNRTTWLDRTIEHTGKAFLGLTLNCAKCHDHKYDPLSQVDYYRFRAIFEPHQVRLDPVPGVTDFEQDGLPRVFDDQLDAVTQLHLRGDPKNPDPSTEITPGVPELFASFAPEVKTIDLPVWAYAPGTRKAVQTDHLAAARARIATAETELAQVRQKQADLLAALSARKPMDAEDILFRDDFDQAMPSAWEMTGDGWEFRDGQLHQTVATRESHKLRTKSEQPRDFELMCRYTTTGGDVYKSVTFRFDESADGQYSNFVYTSAYASGPKVQVASTRDGKTTYPDKGRAAHPIEVGKTYEIRVAVRDRLVNVWLDGKFLLAYELPDRPETGLISLAGFDATVAFDWVTVRPLPTDYEMQGVDGKSLGSEKDAQRAVQLAELKLQAEQASLAALEAVIAADTARWTESAAEETWKPLAQQAAITSAEAELATARFEVTRDTKLGDEPTKEATKRIEQAEAKVTKANEGTIAYQPLRGSLKALEGPSHKETDYPAVYPFQSTGRRLALAKWITSRDNPLTARVAVNHVWLRHFGEPLAESMFDLGLRTPRPEHAELLDYLACELIDSGWSFKHLHRLIVTSDAYRLSSSTLNANSATLAADPTNQFYWRMNSRRMESQIVRDSLLTLAGELDSATGGPTVSPTKPSSRRSIYFTQSRDEQNQFLSMFDDADIMVCYRRTDSIVPQQALALSNSRLSLEMSAKIANRLHEQLGRDDRAVFIQVTFNTLLGRSPTPDEEAACHEFQNEISQIGSAETPAATESRIRTRLVHALLNHNDFITVR